MFLILNPAFIGWLGKAFKSFGSNAAFKPSDKKEKKMPEFLNKWIDKIAPRTNIE